MKIHRFDDNTAHIYVGNTFYIFLCFFLILLLLLLIFSLFYQFFTKETMYFTNKNSILFLFIMLPYLIYTSFTKALKENIIFNKEKGTIFHKISILGITVNSKTIHFKNFQSININKVEKESDNSDSLSENYRLLLNFENLKNYTIPEKNYLSFQEAHELSGLLKSFFVE